MKERRRLTLTLGYVDDDRRFGRIEDVLVVDVDCGAAPMALKVGELVGKALTSRLAKVKPHELQRAIANAERELRGSHGNPRKGRP